MSNMEHQKLMEEKLREAACVGDLDAVKILLNKGVNINDQHSINGWTALHWASRRKHKSIVSYLLSNGADKTLSSHSGETPSMVTEDSDMKFLIDGSTESQKRNSGQFSLPMKAHYLDQPGMGYSVDVGTRPSMCVSSPLTNGISHNMANNELVIKVRQGCIADKDFIEVEISRSELTYISLLKICASELGMDPQRITRIRKLPNTILRKDKDVSRLKDFQEIEVLAGQTFNSSPAFNSSCSSVTTTSAFGTKTTILY